jgi:hypothetical protein
VVVGGQPGQALGQPIASSGNTRLYIPADTHVNFKMGLQRFIHKIHDHAYHSSRQRGHSDKPVPVTDAMEAQLVGYFLWR